MRDELGSEGEELMELDEETEEEVEEETPKEEEEEV